MRRTVLAMILSVVVTGCAGPHTALRRHDAASAAYGAYLRGLMLERSARFPDALDAYRMALEHDRDSAILNVHLGSTYLKLGQMDRALQAFRRALEIDPHQSDALRWVAMLYTSQGRVGEAIAAYEQLLAAQPDDAFILSTLADLYVLQGSLPQAIDAYHRLIEETGSTSQLHFNLGVLHGRLGQFDDAVAELSRALELAPDSADIRVALGLTYELSGRFDEAAAHYEGAIELDPFNPRLYHHAARAYLNGKRYAEAAVNYRAALDVNPREIDAIMGLVRVWLAQRQFDEAAQFLAREIADSGGEQPELYVALGIVYREAQEAQEALRAFERAIAQQDDYAQAHFYLAAELDQLGRRDEARASLRRTLALDPNHSDALNYLGYLDAEDGTNLDEARRLIEHAIELDPDNGAYLDSLGWVYFKLGRLDEAIECLERAARVLGTDPVVFEHLGDVYLEHHDPDNARRAWLRALELDQHQVAIQDKLNRLAPSTEAPVTTR